MIHEYIDSYTIYDPDKWLWSVKQTSENFELYRKFRMRRSHKKEDYYSNVDVMPDFTSIEKEANTFNMRSVEWTDIFGICWEGKRGSYVNVGPPDYQGHLYYFDTEEEQYDVTYEYDSWENKPDPDVFIELQGNGIRYIDIKNIKSITYKWIAWNHLFKDTHFELEYEGEEDNDNRVVYVWYNNDYKKFLHALKAMRPDLLPDVIKSIDEHFDAYLSPMNKEYASYHPGKTATEYFEL